jgi:Zn-dependent protease
MNIDQLIQTISIFALPVIFAITVHEAAHGYVARYFGDPTAHLLGRITLNPMRHIDPVGTILIPLVLAFATAGKFVFGYAKPVPVDFGQLRRPKRDMVWVALAGPAVNFMQAILWQTALIVMLAAGVQERFWLSMAAAGVLVNIVMAVFNLFPLPPLDGGRILVGLLPWRQAVMVSRIEPYGFFIVLALLIAGIITEWWMRPLMLISELAIDLLLSPLRMMLGV